MPTIKDIIAGEEYSSDYREAAFRAWYQAERPTMSKLRELLNPDSRGRIPELSVIGHWKLDDDWDARADALDGNAQIQLDNQSIQARIEMLQKHAQMGKELSDKGREYLSKNGFDTGAEAIRAIIEGVKLERQSAGYAEFLARIADASDEDLNKELQKMLTKGSDFIDAEVKDTNDELTTGTSSQGESDTGPET